MVLCWSWHLKLLRRYPLRSLISSYDELYFKESFFRGSAASHTPKFFTSKRAVQTVNCHGNFFRLEKIQELGPIPCDSLYINLPVNSQAPSLWNLIKCMNGEFFGWGGEAENFTERVGWGGPGWWWVKKRCDFKGFAYGPRVAVFFVVELLLPGRRTPARSANSLQPALDQWELFPREAWKRMDPTWRIVDERNAIGIVVRTQGPFREIFFDFQRSDEIQEL